MKLVLCGERSFGVLLRRCSADWVKPAFAFSTGGVVRVDWSMEQYEGTDVTVNAYKAEDKCLIRADCPTLCGLRRALGLLSNVILNLTVMPFPGVLGAVITAAGFYVFSDLFLKLIACRATQAAL